jgi:hypothetical protein
LTRIAVSGHRGLTPDVEALIEHAIGAELAPFAADGNPLVGLSCLADGADQIFATAVLELGGTLEAVIPAERYRDGLPDAAKPAYDDLLSRAASVRRCEHDESNSRAHMDASILMVDSADRLFAVWDGQPARGFGGTADVVTYARDKGLPVHVIWPAGAHR